jgi:hypothetical protein
MLFILLIVPLGTAHAQPHAADTIFLLSAMKNARDLYSRSLGVSSHLLNGVQYKEYNPHFDDEGHPYFASDDWVEGSVYYDGQWYDGVAILYDLVKEKVVIEHPFAGIKLELISEKINCVTLPGHRFVRLDADTIKDSPIRTGLYDLLYDGPTKFYVKRQKQQKDEIAGHEIQVKFSENDRLYIYKKGLYIPVKSKSSLLHVLGDRKTEIRKYIRKSKIHFRRGREEAIARVVSFYDESGK